MLTLTYILLWLALAAYAVHLVSGRRWMGWAATGTTTIAWGTLTAGLIKRGLEAGHWPLTNRYEFALCFVWAIVAVYLLLEASWRERRAGAFVLAVALLAATYAVTRPAGEQATAPLLPALRSVWLQVHVLTALVGYGAFGVAAGLGLAQLARNRVFLKNPVSCQGMQLVFVGASGYATEGGAGAEVSWNRRPRRGFREVVGCTCDHFMTRPRVSSGEHWSICITW